MAATNEDARNLMTVLGVKILEIESERDGYRAALADMVAGTPGARERAVGILRNGPHVASAPASVIVTPALPTNAEDESTVGALVAQATGKTGPMAPAAGAEVCPRCLGEGESGGCDMCGGTGRRAT